MSVLSERYGKLCYLDFCIRFMGFQFYVITTGEDLDKSEAYQMYLKGMFTIEKLRCHHAMVEIRNKSGWFAGQRIGVQGTGLQKRRIH